MEITTVARFPAASNRVPTAALRMFGCDGSPRSYTHGYALLSLIRERRRSMLGAGDDPVARSGADQEGGQSECDTASG